MISKFLILTSSVCYFPGDFSPNLGIYFKMVNNKCFWGSFSHQILKKLLFFKIAIFYIKKF